MAQVQIVDITTLLIARQDRDTSFRSVSSHKDELDPRSQAVERREDFSLLYASRIFTLESLIDGTSNGSGKCFETFERLFPKDVVRYRREEAVPFKQVGFLLGYQKKFHLF